MMWWTIINLTPRCLIPFISSAPFPSLMLSLENFFSCWKTCMHAQLTAMYKRGRERGSPMGWEMLVKTANDPLEAQPSATRDGDSVPFIVRKYIIDNLPWEAATISMTILF
jgi:hypothetical protein